MIKKLVIAIGLAAALATTTADAALLPRLGGKALYDDLADLTWLQDANLAKTSGYDADGQMTWTDANTWAGSLNIDGVMGWQLPGGSMTSGYNQTASAMGNLFYNVLGGMAGADIATTHNANYHLFSNVQSFYYWSGVEFDSSTAWIFYFNGGPQYLGDKPSILFAWAVHYGDVRPVPLPAAAFLLAPALGGLDFMRRRAN